MNLSRILQSVPFPMPTQPAISAPGVSLTYADFEGQVAAIAGALVQRHGLRKGDRVGIWMENCAELFPVLFGIWRAGLAAVPINNKLHPKELQWILDNSSAKLCVVTPDLAEKLSQFTYPLEQLGRTGPVFARPREWCLADRSRQCGDCLGAGLNAHSVKRREVCLQFRE